MRSGSITSTANGTGTYDGEVRLGFGKHIGKKLADVARLDTWYKDYLLKKSFPFAPESVRMEVVRHGLASMEDMRIDPNRLESAAQ